MGVSMSEAADARSRRHGGFGVLSAREPPFRYRPVSARQATDHEGPLCGRQATFKPAHYRHRAGLTFRGNRRQALEPPPPSAYTMEA